MMKLWNKKGISPLIATVLIIGFTVALAAVVMTWGTGFVRSTTEETSESTNLALECSRLNYQIGAVICDATKVKVVSVEVLNNGDVGLVGSVFRISRSTGTATSSLDGVAGANLVGPFEVKTLTLNPADAGTTAPSKLGVIVKIKSQQSGEFFTCADTLREKAFPCS